MRVLVSGATGLIGSALVARLGQTGHAAIRLVRTDPGRGGTDVRWDPAAGALDTAPLEGLDAVVHLAGEDIASGAGMNAKKARSARAAWTHRAPRTDRRRLSRPPDVLACASARDTTANGRRSPDEERARRERAFSPPSAAMGASGRAREPRPASAAALRFGRLSSTVRWAPVQMLGLFRKGMGGPIAVGAST